MYIKNLRIYNFKLLQKLTWANRIDHFGNRFVVMLHNFNLADQTAESYVCVEAVRTIEPEIKLEGIKLRSARSYYKKAKKDLKRMQLLYDDLIKIQESQQERHQFLESQIEVAEQYRKEW